MSTTTQRTGGADATVTRDWCEDREELHRLWCWLKDRDEIEDREAGRFMDEPWHWQWAYDEMRSEERTAEANEPDRWLER